MILSIAEEINKKVAAEITFPRPVRRHTFGVANDLTFLFGKSAMVCSGCSEEHAKNKETEGNVRPRGEHLQGLQPIPSLTKTGESSPFHGARNFLSCAHHWHKGRGLATSKARARADA